MQRRGTWSIITKGRRRRCVPSSSTVRREQSVGNQTFLCLNWRTNIFYLPYDWSFSFCFDGGSSSECEKLLYFWGTIKNSMNEMLATVQDMLMYFFSTYKHIKYLFSKNIKMLFIICICLIDIVYMGTAWATINSCTAPLESIHTPWLFTFCCVAASI